VDQRPVQLVQQRSGRALDDGIGITGIGITIIGGGIQPQTFGQQTEPSQLLVKVVRTDRREEGPGPQQRA
jgi:hypothetical protein